MSTRWSLVRRTLGVGVVCSCIAAGVCLAACQDDPDPQPRAPVQTPLALEQVAVRAIGQAGTAEEISSQVCALCHGARGEGNVQLRAPSIAGQPKWYLLMQLDQFRGGRRGAHPDDASGRQMATVARALPESALEAVAALFAGKPPFATRATVGGDADHGRLVYEAECMECHRFNGQGEKVFRSSPLTSFQDWYLAQELEEFRSGVRGQDPADRHGEKMRDVARLLDAKARRDVIAYIAELASEHPPGK